jgi:hypothetical protein
MARLEDYSFGRLTVDGQEHTRDLIVLPDRVVGDWCACPPTRRCAATGSSTSAARRRRCI